MVTETSQAQDELLIRIDSTIAELLKLSASFQYQEIDREEQEDPKFRTVQTVHYQAEGKETVHNRELLQDRGGSYVLALTPKEEVILLLQVRPGLEQSFQVELPAGGLSKNEIPEINALTELMKETGADQTLSSFEFLGSGPVLAGRSPQETHFFLAQGVNFDPQNQDLESGELIIPFTVPIEDVEPLVREIMTRPELKEKGLGVDPKILAALSLAKPHLET